MPRVLFAGFPSELAMDVVRRLPGTTQDTAADADQALLMLGEGEYDALVLAHDLAGERTASEVLGHARAALGENAMKAIVVLPRDAAPQVVMHFVNDLKVEQLLFQPIDVEALLAPVGEAIGVEPGAPPEEKRPDVRAGVLAGLWDRFREATLKRVTTVEAAAQALMASALTPTQRHEAEREAHKLRGALGTFGFPEGSRIAAELEAHFEGNSPLGATQALLIAELLVALRTELASQPGTSSPLEVETDPSGSRVYTLLIVEDDEAIADGLTEEALARGLRVERATDVVTAREILRTRRPQAVIVDLDLGPGGPDGRTLLVELATLDPPVVRLVLTGRGTLVERLEAARLGSAGFIEKPTLPAIVIDAVERALNPRLGTAPKVLAVDDDPAILAAIEALLTPRGIHVLTIDDPLRFWTALEEHQPDLIMLDMDMPFLNGLELCRVVRNSLHWCSTPILFLTARTDAASVQRIFAAGADDYVSKPILGPELTTRIANRLERTRLVQHIAEMTERVDHAATAGALPE